MSEIQRLRGMLKLQLTPADEGMITNQEEEICHLQEENTRDMLPLLAMKEQNPSEHQEWNLRINQEDIKEEQGLWISRQGEQLQQVEEADLAKFGFTAVIVKSESDDEKPESSQLHQSRSEERTEAEPVVGSSSVHRTVTAEADGEDDGGLQPGRTSSSNIYVQPDTSDKSSDSSGSETDDSCDWKQTRELQSHFNIIVRSRNCNIDEKLFNCSRYTKASGHMNNLEQHKGSQVSEKTFCCSDQSKRYEAKGSLNKDMTIEIGNKQFACSECGRRFRRKSQLKTHMIIHTGQK